MIHGGGDTYIKPDMARALFDCAGEPKEFWLVEKAKHNQALHVAGDEYRRRVLAFFDQHLAAQPRPDAARPATERCRSHGRRAAADVAVRRAARSAGRLAAVSDRRYTPSA